MSFSTGVKDEIAFIDTKARHCNLALLSSILFTSDITLDGCDLKITFDSFKVAQLVQVVIKDYFEYNAKVHNAKGKSFILHIESEEVIKNIFSATGYNINMQIDTLVLKRECCKKQFLKGFFLTSGSLSNPNKAYHLEFVLANKTTATDISNVINYFGLNAKVIERKSSYVVYLKEADQIALLLNIIGAHVNLLEFENVRIMKDVRNNINRVVNCDVKNISRVVEAANFHIDNIQYIEKSKGFNILTHELRELAQIRIDFPDISLKEMGEKTNPPISKSCVNYRLRKLSNIAKSIRGGL